MTPSPETPNLMGEQTALACYLSAVVAIGNCMADVCPAVGTVYRDRFLRVPRRLGFEATPRALHQSREEFKDLFDNAPLGYHEVDAAGRLLRIRQTVPAIPRRNSPASSIRFG